MEKLGQVTASRLKNTALLWQSNYKLLWYYGSISRDIWFANMRPEAIADEEFKTASLIWRKNYTLGFYGWSSDNGYVLTNGLSDKKIEVLDDQARLHTVGGDWIYLRIPAEGAEAELKAQFAHLLRTHPMRSVVETAQSGGVTFPFSSFKGMDLAVLQMAADVWRARERDAIELSLGLHRGRKRKIPLQELGNELRVSPSQVVLAEDSPEVRELKGAAMKVAVSRMLNRAEKLIENVEQGVFPSYAPVVKKQRWRTGMAPDFSSHDLLAKWYEHQQNIDVEVELMNARSRALTNRSESKL